MSIFEQIGEEGFARLVRGFYAQVPGDDILGPMYPKDDMDGAEQRLRDFLVFRFGGPDRYIQQRGHPQLRARHMPFPVDLKAAERWLALMDRAFEQAALPPAVETSLRDFFRDTARFMINKGDIPPEPMTELHIELEDGKRLGVTAVLSRQLPPDFEPGMLFRIAGRELELVRTRRTEPVEGAEAAVLLTVRETGE
jgi:hemoglobin